MNYKQLGTSTRNISNIGLGTNFIADITKDEQKLISLIHHACDSGINFFDTAEVYHNGYSETLLGKALRKKRVDVFIATKFSAEHSAYQDVLHSAEKSLKRLDTDHIDLYQIHWPNSIVPFEETLRALDKLVQDGKVRHIGVSNFSLRQLKEIKKLSNLPIMSLQSEYNILERLAEQDLIPYCEKNSITFIAYSPLNSGAMFNAKKHTNVLARLSKKYNKTHSQIFLNYLVSHSPVVAIPATTSTVHLQENTDSTSFVLEKKDTDLLIKTFAVKVTPLETKKIKVASIPGHSAYSTLEEAILNKFNLFPSPQMLSADMSQGDFLKPVKVRTLTSKDGTFEYELINGRIRFWAWVIAFGYDKPIPAIIEE